LALKAGSEIYIRWKKENVLMLMVFNKVIRFEKSAELKKG